LHYAAMMGRVEVMQYLLQKGADVNGRNFTLSSPLHAASLNGKGEWTELLVDSGADVNAENKYGYKPHDYANSKNRGHSPIYNSVDTLDEEEFGM